MVKKDIPFLKQTMADLAATNFPDPNRKKQYLLGGDGKELDDVPALDMLMDAKMAQDHWGKNDESIKNYNANLKILNPLYANLQPIRDVIVRCYHLTTKSENGLFIPINIPVKEITQNGMGVRAVLNSPWKLDTKAVVVAVPKDYESLKVGDVVQIPRNVVTPEKPSVDHDFELPLAYTHPDWFSLNPPTALDNPHFGYLLLSPYEYIKIVLERA